MSQRVRQHHLFLEVRRGSDHGPFLTARREPFHAATREPQTDLIDENHRRSIKRYTMQIQQGESEKLNSSVQLLLHPCVPVRGVSAVLLDLNAFVEPAFADAAREEARQVECFAHYFRLALPCCKGH